MIYRTGSIRVCPKQGCQSMRLWLGRSLWSGHVDIKWHQWWYRTLFWSETLRVLGVIVSDWDRLLQKPTFVGQVPIAAQSVPIPIPFFPWWNITFLKSLRPLTGSHQSLKVHWGLPWSATREVGSKWCDYADVTIIHQSCCCADSADAPAGQDTWKEELLERNRLETDKMVAVSFKDISRIFFILFVHNTCAQNLTLEGLFTMRSNRHHDPLNTECQGSWRHQCYTSKDFIMLLATNWFNLCSWGNPKSMPLNCNFHC